MNNQNIFFSEYDDATLRTDPTLISLDALDISVPEERTQDS